VCAGAGKTNIAMLAVLREVRANMDQQGVIHKADFKVVYVAPMKVRRRRNKGCDSTRT
jgi:replicative superfamily II helicase